jgi:hypothetical protein
MTAEPDLIRCVWCRSELTIESAKPIKHARLDDLPDSENMQCADYEACVQRQDALDAALIVRSRADGYEPLFVGASNPGVLAALEDGERLRAAMAILEAGL